ncbi:MAG: hypothetical protein M1837_001459 [Sclerophora amabilis]|nr:MAG: hypothetical protein M1837_001459 [Sclerophora amabilis]
MFSFSIPKSLIPDAVGARLGQLKFPNRKPMSTPNYLAITSRGVVPHISQDMMRQHTSFSGVQVALEDFIEKAPQSVPPVLNYAKCSKASSPLRSFVALQRDALLLLTPRRIPPVLCPVSNTTSSVSIYTSVGYRQLVHKDYVEAIRALRPDIAVGLADTGHGQKPSAKRIEKMSDRTASWTQEMIETLSEGSKRELDEESNAIPNRALQHQGPAIFAPVLPVDFYQQSENFRQLEEEMNAGVSGLAIYDSAIVPAIPESLTDLPRFSLDEAASPHKLLSQVSIGIDLFTIPFIGAATDAGIALDFSFPPPRPTSSLSVGVTQSEGQSLGVDMWLPIHANDLSPLRHGCTCHACQKYSRAYIQHLLVAKEMLGWVLLQLHNHHVMDEFFVGVRNSLTSGTFEHDQALFNETYEAQLPEKTGQGPRVRGYQHKSGPNAPKANALAFTTLNDAHEKLEESRTSLSPDTVNPQI